MNVLLVTWEYPPRQVGLNAAFIKKTAESLAETNQVYVVSYDTFDSVEQGNPEIHRVTFNVDSNSLFNWALLMNTNLKEACSDIMREKNIDLIHAFEWPSFPAAISLKRLYNKPLFVTMTSTQHQRENDQYANLICDMEWWGCYEADRILASSNSLSSIKQNYSPPEDKVFLCDTPLSVREVYGEKNEATTDNMGISPL